MRDSIDCPEYHTDGAREVSFFHHHYQHERHVGVVRRMEGVSLGVGGKYYECGGLVWGVRRLLNGFSPLENWYMR